MNKCAKLVSRINVALSGTAIQSATKGSKGKAEHAIDGNTDPDYSHDSCTNTGDVDRPWWRLQLPDVYRVSEIEVTELEEGQATELEEGQVTELEEGQATELEEGQVTELEEGQATELEEGQATELEEGQATELEEGQATELEEGQLVPPPPSISIVGMERNLTLVGKRLCWSDALLYCRDFHWDLLSIRGPEDQEIIDELVAKASFPLTSHLWVGLRMPLYGAILYRTTLRIS
ncbi:hypothetical protein CRUP_019660 [Coryphaenoides rupestris]|nr:hypothetical protein CRUP_019660 [Coryphaenoides rupestris]